MNEKNRICFIGAMPVFTDESESKKSSFLSWLIRDEVFCWLAADAMCGFVCCCWNSNVSSLSSHCETLSNLSNLDDSSISTFFTINFVVRLRVSIFKSNVSCVLTECTVKILKTISNIGVKTKFSEVLRFRMKENKYTKNVDPMKSFELSWYREKQKSFHVRDDPIGYLSEDC